MGVYCNINGWMCDFVICLAYSVNQKQKMGQQCVVFFLCSKLCGQLRFSLKSRNGGGNNINLALAITTSQGVVPLEPVILRHS